jgi:S-disulfanyl-L-cysteine oxidoreductase SoxD
MGRIRVSIFLLLLAFFAAAASRSVWDRVYTKAQAARGQTAYGEKCAKCHGANLSGSDESPSLAGEEFLGRWKGRTAGDFFEEMRASMPADDPGHLSLGQYADITAYILSANEFPAGDKELGSTLADLNEIRIELKP